jgi:PhnB protein
MSRRVTKLLEDFHTITPHLTVRGVDSAIAFYRAAFGAEELYRNLAPDGKSVMHAELLLGDSRFLIHDEYPEHGELSPLSYGGSSIKLHLYVDDVDAMFQSAVDAGAQVLMPVENCFWGDRYGILQDPFGHRWSIATRIEDLSPRQLQKRAADFGAEHQDRQAESDSQIDN